MKKLIFLVLTLIGLLFFDRMLAQPIKLPEAQKQVEDLLRQNGISDQDFLTIVTDQLSTQATNNQVDSTIVEAILNNAAEMWAIQCSQKEVQEQAPVNANSSEQEELAQALAQSKQEHSTLNVITYLVDVISKKLSAFKQENKVAQNANQPINFEVAQINATPQTGPSCGYHTIVNATAVKDVFVQDKSLTSDNIKAEFAKYKTVIGNNTLEIGEMLDLATKTKLQHIYFLGLENNVVKPAGTAFTSAEFDQCFSNFKTHNKALALFACNTGGHWVLLAAVKQPGINPHIYYMDSANVALASSPAVQLFVAYLKQQLS